jgi:Family of unknown function (DUF5681)
MSDGGAGYGRPPKASRFKPGVSGNPKGRPKRKPIPFAEVVNQVLDAPIEYLERGRPRVTTRRELTLQKWVDLAIKGDIRAAEQILKIRAHAERDGDPGSETIRVSGWLSDYPGQTAEQKTQDAAQARDGESMKWWEAVQDQRPKDAEPRPDRDVPSSSKPSQVNRDAE